MRVAERRRESNKRKLFFLFSAPLIAWRALKDGLRVQETCEYSSLEKFLAMIFKVQRKCDDTVWYPVHCNHFRLCPSCSTPLLNHTNCKVRPFHHMSPNNSYLRSSLKKALRFIRQTLSGQVCYALARVFLPGRSPQVTSPEVPPCPCLLPESEFLHQHVLWNMLKAAEGLTHVKYLALW